MSQSTATRVRVEPDILKIDETDWNRCASGMPADSNGIYRPENPFVSYGFLAALEESGCVSADTGWVPQHLLVEGEDNQVVAAMPCYLKGHSQGEYVFDYGWADAFERAGGKYYPKLQTSVPFTPATGPKFLVAEEESVADRSRSLMGAVIQLCDQIGASSWHATFLEQYEYDLLGSMGLLQRTGQQFHWFNRDYSSFDEFLGELTSRKRKAIKKERREALADDIDVEIINGKDIQEHHWDCFFQFYIDTGSRKWGYPYLNRKFFSMMHSRMVDSVLLIMAKRNGKYIAGTMHMIGENTLFGRYWGCTEDHRFLHFELCYHQAVDYAIQNGMKKVEAGAQGDHKLARGYEPVNVYSTHYIAHPGLRQAVAQFLEQERQQVTYENEILNDYTPFKKGE